MPSNTWEISDQETEKLTGLVLYVLGLMTLPLYGLGLALIYLGYRIRQKAETHGEG